MEHPAPLNWGAGQAHFRLAVLLVTVRTPADPEIPWAVKLTVLPARRRPVAPAADQCLCQPPECGLGDQYCRVDDRPTNRATWEVWLDAHRWCASLESLSGFAMLSQWLAPVIPRTGERDPLCGMGSQPVLSWLQLACVSPEIRTGRLIHSVKRAVISCTVRTNWQAATRHDPPGAPELRPPSLTGR